MIDIQAQLDQQWATMEACVDSLSDMAGLMNHKSIITAAIVLVVLEIRMRQLNRSKDET